MAPCPSVATVKMRSAYGCLMSGPCHPPPIAAVRTSEQHYPTSQAQREQILKFALLNRASVVWCAYRTRTCDPRITKASNAAGIVEHLHDLMGLYRTSRRRCPVTSQFGLRSPIGHFLAKALWLGKSRKVDLRYTCGHAPNANDEARGNPIAA